MVEETLIKTHLIITDIHEEYDINWCGRLLDANPLFKNNMPVFLIISGTTRVELNTLDITKIEECAKRITLPKGRAAITSDSANIYLVEANGNEKFMGSVVHRHVKKYSQMFDKIGYR